MKILVTGKGGDAGSWAIRGKQLGMAIGATVKAMATLADCEAADLIVVVKKCPPLLMDAVLLSGKPWVLDLVDGWPQPCTWDAVQFRAWLQELLGTLRPTGVVYGTELMREDAGVNGLILPHHSWSKYADRTPIFRQELRTIGYEGGTQYLGKWHDILARQCARRGLSMIINGDMSQADIGLALRDPCSYGDRWWKPGTKLSNLQALGIPAICNREAGYESVASGGEWWVDSEADLIAALDALQDAGTRQTIGTMMRTAMIRIEKVASIYRKWLESFA